MHRLPPAARHPRVAHLRAAEHPQAHVHPLVRDQLEPRHEALAPRLAQPRPVLGRAAQRLGALLGVGSWSGGQPAARCRTRSLFHSIWKATSVGIRSSTSEGLEISTACVPSPASYQRRRRAGASTSCHSSIEMPLLLEDLALLAQDHELRAVGHRVRHAPDRVDEGAEVGLVAVGQRVEARAHGAVRRLEHAQVRLAARAQQRVVGALVELDLVAEAPPVLVRGAGDDKPGYDQELLLHVRHADCGGRSGPADDAGHRDQGQDIWQRLE